MVVRVGGGILEWCERDVVVAADDLARDASAFISFLQLFHAKAQLWSSYH